MQACSVQCAYSHERFNVFVVKRIGQGKLTRREVEILQLVAQGLTNNEIAGILKVTRGTIDSHIHHIIQKLDVSNRTQAAAWAFRNKVADDSYTEWQD